MNRSVVLSITNAKWQKKSCFGGKNLCFALSVITQNRINILSLMKELLSMNHWPDVDLTKALSITSLSAKEASWWGQWSNLLDQKPQFGVQALRQLGISNKNFNYWLKCLETKLHNGVWYHDFILAVWMLKSIGFMGYELL